MRVRSHFLDAGEADVAGVNGFAGAVGEFEDQGAVGAEICERCPDLGYRRHSTVTSPSRPLAWASQSARIAAKPLPSFQIAKPI